MEYIIIFFRCKKLPCRAKNYSPMYAHTRQNTVKKRKKLKWNFLFVLSSSLDQLYDMMTIYNLFSPQNAFIAAFFFKESMLYLLFIWEIKNYCIYSRISRPAYKSKLIFLVQNLTKIVNFWNLIFINKKPKYVI